MENLSKLKLIFSLAMLAACMFFLSSCDKEEGPAPAPGITSFSPDSGLEGDEVIITGKNFSATPSENVVKFNGTSATVASATTTKLTVTVPEGATTGKITILANGQTVTSTDDFTVIHPPTISSFLPERGIERDEIVITGENFSATVSDNTVEFNGVSATVTEASDTSLTVLVPSGASTGKISVTVNEQSTTSVDDFTVLKLLIPSDGLIAYYTLDNEAIDKSGNDNDGQIVEAIGSTDRRENENGALTFNGVDAKVVTTTKIDDSLATGLTFSAWIYYTGENVGRIISNYNGQGAQGACKSRIGFVFGVTSTKQLNIFYATDGNDRIGRMTAENTIPTNEWVHVLGTWDGTFASSGFKLYINGSQLDNENSETGSVTCGYRQSLNPFHIGMGHCSTGECAPFEGKIDDVRIYSKVLNTGSIKLLSEEE